MAVIIPIGSSTLWIKIREIKSAQIINKAPQTAVNGSVTCGHYQTSHEQYVWHDEADKTDHA